MTCLMPITAYMLLADPTIQIVWPVRTFEEAGYVDWNILRSLPDRCVVKQK